MRNNEIKYDFSYIDESIKQLEKVKREFPFSNGKRQRDELDYLFTGLSKGNVIDALIKFDELTADRGIQIEKLIVNIIDVLKNARKDMANKDNEIARGINK